MKIIGYCALAFVGFVAFILFIGSQMGDDPEFKEKQRARQVIDQCDKLAADQLQELSTRRFVRGTCDMMRTKFRDKYHVEP